MSFLINQHVTAATKFDSYLSELPAWMEWHHAPESQIFHQTTQSQFQPRRNLTMTAL